MKPRTLILALTVGLTGSLFAQDVSRDLSAASLWQEAQWITAPGKWKNVKEAPAECKGQQSLELSVNYSGKGFQYSGFELKTPPPGNVTSISLWMKTPKNGFAWSFKFSDKDTREKKAKKKLEFNPKCKDNEWTHVNFTVPSDWTQPVKFTGIAAHNYSNKTTGGDQKLLVCDVQVTTDISAVKDKKSLVKLNLGTGLERNIFFKGQTVKYDATIGSWLGKQLNGKLKYTITDADLKTVASKEIPLDFVGSASNAITFSPKKLGPYTLSLTGKLSNGQSFKESSRFIYINPPHKYTDKEKLYSPYAINIHGGQPGVSYNGIAKLGIPWIRDYAYSLAWMVKARGKGDYPGWPWYPSMNKKIADAGLILLPCMSGAIGEEVKQGKLKPESDWKRRVLTAVMDFPEFICWEVDNEYDLHDRRGCEARNWSAYKDYHKAFSMGVKFMNDKLWTVEQGAAGVHPERVESFIKSGAFDNIDVINCHFYCGTDAPELSRYNANTGGSADIPRHIYDKLREFVAVADSDGKDRQAWVTEFGWDTLAGKIVSEKQQSAYLQRGFAMGFTAGMDKMFWYWNRDTKGKPNNFFDGCGIFDPKDEAKPVAAAFATMINFLKKPKAVGTFDLGENSSGYVFEDRGKIVAMAFKVDVDKPGPTVTLNDGKLYDMYGNPLAQKKMTLDIDPVWMVDISKDSAVYKETAFDLKSRIYVRGTAGDPCVIELRVRNNRSSAIKANYKVKIPKGWSVDKATGSIDVAAGKETIYPITVTVDPKAENGYDQVVVTVDENGNEKKLVTDIQVLSAAVVSVEPITGNPGKTKTTATVRNNSLKVQNYTLKPQVPSSWKVTPAQVALDNMKPGEERNIELNLTWNLNWKLGESAKAIVLSKSGREVSSESIVPNGLSIPKLSSIAYDGKFDEWPAEAKLPSWVLGKMGYKPDAEVYAGYSKAGLHFAFKVNNTKASVTDPKWFWAQDCIEIFIDSLNDKTDRDKYGLTDHQFWFCPLVKENRVFAGRWKRGDAIAKTMYDLEGVKSYSAKTDNGYVAEFLLPAKLIKNFKAQSGQKIGVNFNVSINTDRGRSEVFWPRAKDTNAAGKPASWGIVELK